MATVNKNFRIKDGLIVEGTTGTINGENILTTGSTTSDLTEGTNQYFTDQRAKDAAATLITGATKTNITITGDGSGLTITAENGVADSTTDDLTEGTTNLYFTSARALDATASAYDAAGAATTAENNAKSYADGLATNYDPAGAATTAENNAKSYADGLATNYDPAGAATTAENNANGYTDSEITTALSTAQGYADTAEANANAYTDNAVAGLNWKQAVNLLSTSDLTLTADFVGGSIDGHAVFTTADAGYRILVNGQDDALENGIYELVLDGGNLIAQRSADADTVAELIGAAVFVVEGTQFGGTSWVQNNHYADSYDDLTWTQFSGSGSVTAGTGITVNGLEVSVNRTTVDAWYDAAGAAATAETNAKSYADGLATNYEPAGAISTAINALTTSDIEEGTNLYFTNTRAVDALEGVVPNFTSVEVNSISKQIAATANIASTVQAAVYSFAKADYRTGKFVVKIDNGTHTEVTEVLLTMDSSDNIAITEYAIVGTNGNRGSITAAVSGANVQILVTPVDTSDVSVFGTLLA